MSYITIRCPTCLGSGKDKLNILKCPECHGLGYETVGQHELEKGEEVDPSTCSLLKGDGDD